MPAEAPTTVVAGHTPVAEKEASRRVVACGGSDARGGACGGANGSYGGQGAGGARGRACVGCREGKADRRVGVHDGGGDRDGACGGASGYGGTCGALTGGGGGLDGCEGREQVSRSDVGSGRSDDNDIKVGDIKVGRGAVAMMEAWARGNTGCIGYDGLNLGWAELV
jgi:hypothetical protein